jgi:hypothetical protein
MVNKKCVFDIEDAKSHPYNYCIAPPDEIAGNVPDNINNCNRWGTDCIKSYGGAMLKYIGNGFLLKSKNILSSDCFKMYGNKYVVKTNNYCTYNGKKVPRYRYINNTRYKEPITEKETSRIENTKVGGLISNIIGSGIPKLLPGNLFFSNTFDKQGTDLECKKVNMKCHFINRKNINNNTSGNSGCVYIPKHELDLINKYEYTDCDESDDNDSIQPFSNLEQAKKLFNSQNNQLNYDENINNIYYLVLSLLIIYLLFKLLNKKR